MGHQTRIGHKVGFSVANRQSQIAAFNSQGLHKCPQYLLGTDKRLLQKGSFHSTEISTRISTEIFRFSLLFHSLWALWDTKNLSKISMNFYLESGPFEETRPQQFLVVGLEFLRVVAKMFRSIIPKKET